MTHSNVRFQVDPASVPSTPSWMEEVAAVAHILSQTGIISAIEDHVQFARARFGTYDTIDFVVELGAYRLKDEGRKVFFTNFEERLNEEVSHPLFGYKATYRRCLELQARLLGKVLTGEIDAYPPLLVK